MATSGRRPARPGGGKPAGSNTTSSSPSAPTGPLRFLFRVDSIQPSNGSGMAPLYHDWVPPKQMDEIETITQGEWYTWAPGAHINTVCMMTPSIPGNPPDQTIDCNTTSLFWDFRANRYYGVPVDCRRENVETLEVKIEGDEERHPTDWRKLYYDYIPRAGVNLTRVDFFGQHEGLGAPASNSWMPQLIPYTSALPPGHDPQHPGNTRLIGKLSLLVALAALSCDYVNIVQTMREAFKPPHWHHHDLGDGRHFQRGVVVQIRRYQNHHRVEHWERGDRGTLISGPEDA